MLQINRDSESLKKEFSNRLWSIRESNPKFDVFLLEILAENTGFVIGGFLRDIINRRCSRDIDIVFDCSQQRLIDALTMSKLHFKINRMQGVKIYLNDFEADVWIMDNNWAFKSRVIHKNTDYLLSALANGCFYNYDSLVMNLHTMAYSIKNYIECATHRKLDILRKSQGYKVRNPTLEANILRAIYVKKVHGLDLSENCLTYIGSTLINLTNKYSDPITGINTVKSNYEKYNSILTDTEVSINIQKILKDLRSIKTSQIDRNQVSLYHNEYFKFSTF